MEDQNFILELIEMYRSLPSLWNVKCKEYSNRDIKNAQYKTLLGKYKEKFPDAEKKDVAQKINSLRTSYRRELRRISSLEKSGAGLSEESEPNLFYFDAFEFLRDVQQPCSSRSSMNKENETEENEIAVKRKRKDAAEERIFLAANRLQQPHDEFRKISETWAVKLRKMDDTQRIFAEKFISEILFEGQMGTLHRNSMHLNVMSRASTPQQLNFSNFPSTFVGAPMTSPQTVSFVDPNFFRTRVQVPFTSPPNLDSNLNSGRNSTVQLPMMSPQNIGVEYIDSSGSSFQPVNSPENISREINLEQTSSETAQYFASFK